MFRDGARTCRRKLEDNADKLVLFLPLCGPQGLNSGLQACVLTILYSLSHLLSLSVSHWDVLSHYPTG